MADAAEGERKPLQMAQITSPASRTTEPQAFIKRGFDECTAMVEYLQSCGDTPPAEVVGEFNALQSAFDNDPETRQPDKDSVTSLINIHAQLSDLVKPARPGSLAYIKQQREQAGGGNPLFFIPLIKYNLVLSIVSLIIFVSISSSGLINFENIQQTFLERQDSQQLIIAAFYVSAALLGACFANLMQLQREVSSGTYDPTQALTYWSQLVLGVIAGYSIAELISMDVETGLTKPLLALLGGFSASAVYKLLNRLVKSLEYMVEGEGMRPAEAARGQDRRGESTQEDGRPRPPV